MKKKTTEQFIEEIFLKVKNDYSVLSEYMGSQSKIAFKHNKCGNVFEMRPNDFLIGQRCPDCSRKEQSANQKYTHRQFIKKVYDLVACEYSVLGYYISSTDKILFKHNDCGFVFIMQPANFLRVDCKRGGQRCPQCAGNKKKTTKKFMHEVYRLEGMNYSVIGEYTSAHEPILIRHNECKFEYKIAPHDFLKGRRCPKCDKCKGEKKIEKFLKSKNIEYEKEYKFDDCKDKRCLPFDFAIFKDNKLICLIEHDGVHHYDPRITTFEITQKHDKLKDQYCSTKQIPLIRIPYFQYELINTILIKELNRFQVNIN